MYLIRDSKLNYGSIRGARPLPAPMWLRPCLGARSNGDFRHRFRIRGHGEAEEGEGFPFWRVPSRIDDLRYRREAAIGKLDEKLVARSSTRLVSGSGRLDSF